MENGFERSMVEVDGVFPPGAYYSHGIVTSGRLLFVAGQVAVDENGDLVGENDVAAQARQVLTNLKRVVESAGGRMEDVARTTVYLTRLDDRGPVGEVRGEFFPAPPPANTLLVVTSLARPEYLVEIDAIVPIR
ncbi:MAG TPA: RidA family protein [Acidimicrobiia bacterium]|nr:RidA family protein [Acidimicrobiia bacterium]